MENRTFRKYNIFKMQYPNLSQPGGSGPVEVPLGQKVNGFTVKNAGNTLVVVNNEPLQPGESQTVGGNEGEIYMGRLDIYFQLPVPAPGIPVNSAWVTVKYYME